MIKRKKELVEYARRLKLASLAEHMTEIIHEAQEKQPTYSEILSCKRSRRKRPEKLSFADEGGRTPCQAYFGRV